MIAMQAGFANPVDDAQAAFRAVLDAIARPGRLAHFAAPAELPPGLGRAAAALALTLVDMDTAVWLSPACAPSADWLRFHCSARVAASPSAARFAFANAAECPPLANFDLGTNEYPDQSTTLVLEVPSLASGGSLALRGPGIETVEHVGIAGLPAGFWGQRDMLHELFPRGLDVVFVAGDVALALPRTTRVEG
ncbi:MAG: phosphonate C-P lyase system protein PhnH [Telmatospirillum sp.]|nr:phosphonate C-P lyase system protein PhnH [Telmatospirillum sp.]